MFLDSRPKSIIHLGKDALQIYIENFPRPLILKFDPSVIQNLEKIDKDWIRFKLGEILKTNQIESLNAILVLSKDVLFVKAFELKDEKERQIELSKFIEELPFNKENASIKEYEQGNRCIAVATGKILYTSFISVLEELNIEVKAILPETVVGETVLNTSSIKTIFKNKLLVKKGSFILPGKTVNKTGKPSLNNSGINPKDNNMPIILSILLVLSIGGVVSFVFKDKIKSIYQKKESEEVIVQEEKKETKEEEKETTTNTVTVDKKELAIEVLNGTGTVGLASSIKKDLQGMGYTQIDTGNADSMNYKTTTITALMSLPDSLLNEMKEYLSKDFKSIEIKKITEEEKEDYDVTITTGEEID